MFQYETTINAFNIKFRNVMNSPHASLFRRHLQDQFSRNQDIFNRLQNVLYQDTGAPLALSSFFLLH